MTTDARLMGPVPRPKTIANEIAERIILAIANGEQEPGERLTEGRIAEIMNVSRVPAREALQHLQSIGIVKPMAPRGLRIVDFSQDRARDIREVRLGLETIGMRNAMTAVRSDADRLAPFDDMIDEMAKISRSEDTVSLAQCDVRFHREIMKLSGNDLLLQIWDGLAPHLVILFCRDWHTHKDKVAEVDLHRRLRQLLAEGRQSAIEPMLEEHFSSS